MTGRDDARAHPSVDELADLRESLLTQADEARVREHVGGCAACTAELAAIDEVAVALRDAGAEPVTMPAAVARAIDDALRDAAATPSSSPRPERVASALVPSRRRWVRPAFGWLAGAAAAVVVIGGIGVGLGNLGSQSDNSAGAGGQRALDSGTGSDPTTQPELSGGATGKQDYALSPLDEYSVGSFARALANDAVVPSAAGPGEGSAQARRCNAPRGIGRLEQPVLWHGRLALLVVRREARVASVYSCDATPGLLYSAPY